MEIQGRIRNIETECTEVVDRFGAIHAKYRGLKAHPYTWLSWYTPSSGNILHEHIPTGYDRPEVSMKVILRKLCEDLELDGSQDSVLEALLVLFWGRNLVNGFRVTEESEYHEKDPCLMEIIMQEITANKIY